MDDARISSRMRTEQHNIARATLPHRRPSASGGIGQGREAAKANPCPMLADVLPRKMARGAGGREDDRRQPLPQNQNALKAALLFAPASGALEPSPRGFCGGGSGGSASRMTRRSPFPCTDAGTDGRTRKPTGRGKDAKGARPSPRGFCGGGL